METAQKNVFSFVKYDISSIINVCVSINFRSRGTSSILVYLKYN